jgi:beta-phosphoglucomutase
MVTFMDNMQARAVIFDFDGVIVDTEPLHYRAFQQILDPRGLGFSWQEYVDTYMGFDDRDAFMEAFSSRGVSLEHEELQRLIARKAGIFQKVIQEGISAYPGVVELIRDLHAAKTPLAICSGALRSDIVPILEMLGISGCFDVIVTAEDVARSKPDPECYRVSFDRLRECRSESEFCTNDTIAIEDTPAGISAASSAGLRVIAVTNSYAAGQLAAADRIVESLEQLRGFPTP